MGNLNSWNGPRLYCTKEEVDEFLCQADTLPFDVKVFCYVLARTGCRISEALNLRKRHVDTNLACLVFETLKRRKRGMFRTVPIPEMLSLELADLTRNLEDNDHLWNFSRTTAYWHVKKCFAEIDMAGANAMPKGLRHAFGVNAVLRKVPLNMLQKWMGHASIKTTAIYANATGKEERKIAARMW